MRRGKSRQPEKASASVVIAGREVFDQRAWNIEARPPFTSCALPRSQLGVFGWFGALFFARPPMGALGACRSGERIKGSGLEGRPRLDRCAGGSRKRKSSRLAGRRRGSGRAGASFARLRIGSSAGRGGPCSRRRGARPAAASTAGQDGLWVLGRPRPSSISENRGGLRLLSSRPVARKG